MTSIADLRYVLEAEIQEMEKRIATVDSAMWRAAFFQKKVTFELVLSWVADVESARHPGQGGYSPAARYLNEHGKTLAVGGCERLIADGIKRAQDAGTDKQVDCAGELKGDELALLRFSGISTAVFADADNSSAQQS